MSPDMIEQANHPSPGLLGSCLSDKEKTIDLLQSALSPLVGAEALKCKLSPLSTQHMRTKGSEISPSGLNIVSENKSSFSSDLQLS